MKLVNFVISLESATSRRVHTAQQFSNSSIGFTFFDAVTPSGADLALKELGLEQDVFTNLSRVEACCFLSHASLWQVCVDQKLEYIGIYEDDVYLGKDAGAFLNQSDWLIGKDIVKLEKFHKKAELSFFGESTSISSRKLYQLLGKNLGAAGYILSNRAAQYLLNELKQGRSVEAVDVYLFNVRKFPRLLATHQLQPALVIQEMFYVKHPKLTSSLEGDRCCDKDKKQQIELTAKVKREWLRMVRSVWMHKLRFR